MSCNKPYFKTLLGAVRNTWAKPLIQNKYPNITWFSYTTCDEKHPNPYVDFEEHMIYVKCGDTLGDTMQKTIDAYNMVKHIDQFDYVVRTNTSVYVNIENMLNRIELMYNMNEPTVCGTFSRIKTSDNEVFWMAIGYFFITNHEVFDIMTSKNDYVDSNNDYNMDDVLMFKNLYHVLGNDWGDITINESGEIPWYKGIKDGREIPIDYQITNMKLTRDPNVVNDNVLVRLRPEYKEKREEMCEVQHFYELHDALI